MGEGESKAELEEPGTESAVQGRLGPALLLPEPAFLPCHFCGLRRKIRIFCQNSLQDETIRAFEVAVAVEEKICRGHHSSDLDKFDSAVIHFGGAGDVVVAIWVGYSPNGHVRFCPTSELSEVEELRQRLLAYCEARGQANEAAATPLSLFSGVLLHPELPVLSPHFVIHCPGRSATRYCWTQQ